MKIAIIGGGPVGLYSAYWAKKRGLDVSLFESLSSLGGQLSTLFPEKNIFDLPGIEEINSKSYAKQLENQVLSQDVNIHINEKVIDIVKNDEKEFKIITIASTYKFNAVLICTGCGAFKPQKLQIEQNLERLYQKKIFYFVTNKTTFKNKRMLILGGGDTAVDNAMLLQNECSEIALVHRRTKFRALEKSVNMIDKSDIKIFTSRILKTIEYKEDELQVTILNSISKKVEKISTDYILVNYGFVSEHEEFESCKVKTLHTKICVDNSMSTNISGIFSAGDSVFYENKKYRMITGFGEVPTVIHSILDYLNEERGE